LGHGDGTFGAPLQIAVTYPLYGLGIGDFNHDQKLDVIFSDTNTGTQQMRGNGDGTFQSAQPVSPITGGGVVVGDFNGDGKPDVAVGGIGPDGSYQVLLGKGDGTFQALSGVVPGLSGTLFTADLNHDGRTDMIANDVHVLECQGFLFRGNIIDTSIQAFVPDSTGNFHPAQQVASGSYNYCTATGNRVSVAGLGDYDGDGNEDVVVADSKAGRLFYAGNGDGTFASNPASISGFPGLPAADLNGDKLADGVEVLSSSTIGVVLNTTQGFWLGAPASFGPLRAGGSATATISVNPQNGFTEPVSLTCSAPQSAGIQCSLSSLSITPGGNSTLTVTTTGNSASSRFPTGRSHSEWFYALCLPFAATVFGGLGFGSKGDAKRKLSVFAIGGLLLAGIALQAACGGGSSRPSHNPGTPVGTYAITVTGTSGTIAHSTTVQLTVQ
jgi:hypothetical protein